MVEFRFSVQEDKEHPPEGYEVGHMGVIGTHGSVSSQDAPGQSMLIYISLSDLLDGLGSIIKRGRGSAKFEATGGSFRLKFSLKKNGPLVTTAGKTVIDESPPMAVAAAAWSAAQEFTGRHLGELPPDGDVRNVLEESLAKFQDVLYRKAG